MEISNLPTLEKTSNYFSTLENFQNNAISLISDSAYIPDLKYLPEREKYF